MSTDKVDGHWYSSGWGAKEAEQARQEERRAQDGKRRWFWVGVSSPEEDKSRQIIFLDDFTWKTENGNDVIPFCLRFHNIVKDGDWKHPVHEPCVSQRGGCVLCANGFTSQFVGIFSVIDIARWRDPETGKEVIRPQVSILPAVNEALNVIQSRYKRLNNLQGWLFSVARHDMKAARAGSDFMPEQKLESIEGYLREKGLWPEADSKYPLDLRPFGMRADEALAFYREMFKPKEPDVLRKMLSSVKCSDGLTWYRDKKKAGAGKDKGADDDGGIVDYDE